jgi:cytochrome oxidase assembly protein ShyY1
MEEEMNNRIKKFLDAEQNSAPVPYEEHQQPDETSFCEYRKVCINCGSEHDLKVYAHGNNEKDMVGMLIFCGTCAVKYKGKNIRVNIDIRE